MRPTAWPRRWPRPNTSEFYETLGGKPVHHTLATHWARLVELLYAAERWVELATDPQITSKEYRVLPTETPTEGVGCVEAPAARSPTTTRPTNAAS